MSSCSFLRCERKPVVTVITKEFMKCFCKRHWKQFKEKKEPISGGENND